MTGSIFLNNLVIVKKKIPVQFCDIHLGAEGRDAVRLTVAFQLCLSGESVANCDPAAVSTELIQGSSCLPL